jgi:hypothetical protein
LFFIQSTDFAQRKRLIDVTLPFDDGLDPKASCFFDKLLNPREPLPHYDCHPGVGWESLLPRFISRANQVIDVLENAPASIDASWVRVSGKGGLLMVMRYIEFTRRVALQADYARFQGDVDRILSRLNNVLPKEMFRRWAVASFHVSYHEHCHDLLPLWKIYMETLMKDKVGSEEVSDIS